MNSDVRVCELLDDNSFLYILDQYGKVNSYQKTSYYPLMNNNNDNNTPSVSTGYQDCFTISLDDQEQVHQQDDILLDQHNGQQQDDQLNDARSFLNKFNNQQRQQEYDQQYHHPSPATEYFIQPSPNKLDTPISRSTSYSEHANIMIDNKSKFNLPAPVDPHDELVTRSEVLAQQLFTKQQQDKMSKSNIGLQSPQAQAEELLERFQRITSPDKTKSYPGVSEFVDENINDAEVSLMQSELARTCKREYGKYSNVSVSELLNDVMLLLMMIALQEDHRRACLSLQDSWDKLTRLR